jgi:cell shape-determining protein MreC
MDISILITGCIGILTTIAGSWSSWIFARRKYNSEVDNNVIGNMKSVLDFYKVLCDDNRNRLNETIAELNAVKLENERLKQELSEVKQQMHKLMMRLDEPKRVKNKRDK